MDETVDAKLIVVESFDTVILVLNIVVEKEVLIDVNVDNVTTKAEIDDFDAVTVVVAL